MSRRKKDSNEQYETTVEKVKKGETFKAIFKNGPTKKVYVQTGYNRFAKRYQAYSYENINEFRDFKKGKRVLANPDF